MCWNREVSIITGTTATALSLYLLTFPRTRNDVPIALLVMAVALMQFAEARMWEATATATMPKNQQDHTQQTKATQGAHLGLVALFLQPLALALGLAWANKAPLAGLVYAALWCTLGLPTLIPLLRRPWAAPTPGRCGHLQWTFLDPMLHSPFAPLYWATMLGAWIFMKPLQEGLYYAVAAATTLFVTTQFFPGEWGTLWCFIANWLPLGRIIY